MSKTVLLDDDVHTLIVDKQKELKKRRNVTVRISDLLAMYVKHGIEKTEKLLGFIDDKKSNISDGENVEKSNIADIENDEEVKE